MSRTRTYKMKNITIICDETCPIYYCDEPCKVQKHVKKYSRFMDEEGSFTIL